MKLALVTNADYPNFTDDDALLVEPLNALKIDVTPCAWDDSDVCWEDFDAIVLRSPYGYYKCLDAFVAWIKRLEMAHLNVFNSPKTILWNSDKHYLLGLEKRGFKILPSVIVEPGDKITLRGVLDAQGWHEAVLKPVISASAFLTHKVSIESAHRDQPLLDEALLHSAVIVQEFAADICEHGEWSLAFFNGEFSHAIHKMPKAGDFRVQNEFGGAYSAAMPPPSLLEECRKVVLDLPELPLYARVDCLFRKGKMYLMELELIEPGLFFSFDPNSAKRMANAIAESCIRKPMEAISAP